MKIEFNPQQERIIATGLTVIAGAVILTAIAFLFVYTVEFFVRFNHVFLPLAVAGILAMLLEPWYDWLRLKAGLPSALALVVVFLSLLLPLAALVVFFGAIIFEQLTGLLGQIPVLWEKAIQWIHAHRPDIDRFFSSSTVGKKLTEAVNQPGGPVAELTEYLMSRAVSAGSGIVSGVVSFLGWVVTPVYLAFFLLMPKLRPQALSAEAFPFLKPATAKDAVYLVTEFINLVILFFRGQIIIALIQGMLYAIGFSLVNLQYGATLGLILGFLNIIPYLGAALGLAICLPLAWFQQDGGMTLLLLVFAVFSLVQLVESYYLTPKIMGDKTGLNPLVIIVAIFFWGSALGGILGMILAIPLTAFLVVLWRLAREKYIGQLF